MTGYTIGEVSEVVGLPTSRVRSYARSGLVDPGRGPKNEYRFSFQDIILLRVARELGDQDVPSRRIRRALLRLRDQLPEGRPLSAVNIAAAGEHVVVRDRGTLWEPETGQLAFDFSVEELAARVEPFARRAAEETVQAGEMDADDWYDLGVDLEAVSVHQAEAAYGEALTRDPGHSDAHLNLGRLLHERDCFQEAEKHYRTAWELAPSSGLAPFNLGVALEDLGQREAAMEAYQIAVEAEPGLAGAHFNLARLCEETGDVSGAVRHLAAYRRLKAQAGY